MRLPAEILLAARLAARELRGGLRGFIIFLACLALGVGAIATVRSVSSGVLEGLEADGRAILGGDLSLRQIYRPVPDETARWLQDRGEVSVSVELRAMGRVPGRDDSTLIQLKTVDGAYPLYGRMEIEGGGDVHALLAEEDSRFGAVVDSLILDRLGLEVGGRLAVGEGEFEIRGVIEREPDRASGGALDIGPRVMLSEAGMATTGLVREGSMLYYAYRLKLPPGSDAEAVAQAAREAFPNAPWRIRLFTDAAPQLERMINRLTLFLTLVGLTALVVGGVGVGNAVKAHMDGRIATIATFKCLGASGRLVFTVYLIQVGAIATVGVAAGLLVGATAPLGVAWLIDGLLPIDARIGVYPGGLALAAAFGYLTALVFSLWPLARAHVTRAAALFRDLVAPEGEVRPPRPYMAAMLVAGAGLAGLAIATAIDRELAAGFVAGALASILVFRLLAAAVQEAGRRIGRPRRPALRLAVANLIRPGSPAPQVVLSLGLGLTVLVAIAVVQSNLSDQVNRQIPDQAPSYFFVDVQSSDIEAFNRLVTDHPGTSGLEEVPSLRGRIVAINGDPAEERLVDPNRAWLINGDRGVTYARSPGPRDRIVEGEWWAESYDGPPLVSLYRDIAEAFDVKVGDRFTVNVLGRDIEATVANFRDIDWQTLELNFTIVLSPYPVSAAPHTFLATVKVDGDANEATLQRAVTQAFPTVTAVRIKEALELVDDVLRKIALAVRSTAGVTLAAGLLVLAGAVAAGHRRRVYDAVVLKVLGATRADMLRAFLLEYGLLGLVTALLAAVVGTIAGWAVTTEVMGLDWAFEPVGVAAVVVLATAVTLIFGFVGTWIALGEKAAPHLRNE